MTRQIFTTEFRRDNPFCLITPSEASFMFNARIRIWLFGEWNGIIVRLDLHDLKSVAQK